jgi:methyl-accepting chemotaxis protein
MTRTQPTLNPSAATALSPSILGAQRWRLWAMMLAVGLILLGFSQTLSHQKSLAWADENGLQATLREKVADIQVQSALAANLVPGSLESFATARNSLSAAIGQAKASGRDVSKIEQALGVFDQAMAPVSGASASLVKASDAEAKFSSSLSDLSDANKRVAANQSLSSGYWATALAPIRQDLSSKEIDEMPVIFAPIQGGRALQRQWSDLFSARARDLQSVNDVAQKNDGLDAQSKATVFSFAKAATTVALYARALAETIDVRIAAKNASTDIIRTSNILMDAASSQLVQAEPPAPLLLYVSWVFTVFIFCVLLVSLIKIDASVSMFGADVQQSSAAREAIDRLTRQFGRILRMEGSQLRLDEPPESPLFPLSSMANRLIDWRDTTLQTVSDQSSALDEVRQQMLTEGKALGEQASLYESSTEALLGSVYADAESFAEFGLRARQQIEGLQQSLGLLRNSSGLAQEGAWKNDSLRENAQGTAKRIKRMGESTQEISVSIDFIREIARRILVLSVNGAIEAAGDSDRQQFGVIVQEVQRLAQNAIGSLKEIDSITTAMQIDAKETVVTMEQSTAEVVAGGQLAARLGAVLKDLDSLCSQAIQDGSVTLDRAEAAALRSVEVSKSPQMQSEVSMRSRVGRIYEISARTREMVESFRRIGKSVG